MFSKIILEKEAINFRKGSNSNESLYRLAYFVGSNYYNVYPKEPITELVKHTEYFDAHLLTAQKGFYLVDQ